MEAFFSGQGDGSGIDVPLEAYVVERRLKIVALFGDGMPRDA